MRPWQAHMRSSPPLQALVVVVLVVVGPCHACVQMLAPLFGSH